MQPDFVENVRNIVVETGVNPAWLDLEITETSLMESFDFNKKKLGEIKKLGISISLDDFGTGYSSLNYLKTLPIDCVKIDKGFVDTMLQSEKDSKIINSIIKLAHNIGLKVVAEGVEDENQFQLLRDYKIEFIQGYYFSKPVNYNEVVILIQSIRPPEE
jgi:EAL domain-containing protein (putative c-di-GMP-specific phosphodiesterase class I)